MKTSHIIISLSFGLLISIPATAQHTLSLKQIKQLAVEHNIIMRSANNSIKQSQEQEKEAFTNYFPQISAVGMGFKSNKDMMKTELNTAELLPSSIAASIPPQIAAGIPTTIPISMIDKGVVLGVTAIQPLFTGGQIINGNKLAKVGTEVSMLKKQLSENDVEMTAEQYFWQIVSLKEKMKTLDAVAEMLKKMENDVDIAVKAGVGIRNDLLQVQLKENEIQSNKIQVENGLKLSLMVLAQYIGMEDSEIDLLSPIDPTHVPDYPIIKVDHGEAVYSTMEYQLLQKGLEVATLQKKIAVGKNLPSVGVGVGYNYYNMGSNMNNHFGEVFATVSIPISKWWGGSHVVKRSKLAEENAKEELKDNSQLLKIKMQKNWNDMDAAYKQLQLSKKGIEQSEENLRLNSEYYHAGTVTINALLDAQQQYQQCRDRYTDAYATLQTKISEYEKSIGR